MVFVMLLERELRTSFLKKMLLFFMKSNSDMNIFYTVWNYLLIHTKNFRP